MTRADPRVALLRQLARKEAQSALRQDALGHGALTSSELASRSGPARVTNVTIACRMWAEPLATVYFATDRAAREWAGDLVSRLPDLVGPEDGERGPLWHLEISTADVIRSTPTAALSPWRATQRIVVEILEPHDPDADLCTRATTAYGSARSLAPVAVGPTGRASH